MVVEKVINNNIVSAFDENGNEVVVMGRGLGFQIKPGEEINQRKIEKIFRMGTIQQTERLQVVLADVPLENIQVCNEIIAYAKTVITNKLSKNIYITLTDHINYAINRYHDGIIFRNSLLWEVKKFYQQEFQVGMKAVELLKERFGVDLSEDEAASIALHFVNAEFGTELPVMMDITKLIQNVLKIVTYHFQTVVDEDSLHYERFITHMRFFSQRVVSNNYNSSNDEVFHDMIRKQYPEAYKCVEKIRAYIEKEYHVTIPDEEMTYLTVHIKRIIEN